MARTRKRAKRSKKWIARALAGHPRGFLHKKLGVPVGERIPEGLLKKAERAGGLLAKEAHLAETLTRISRRRRGKRRRARAS